MLIKPRVYQSHERGGAGSIGPIRNMDRATCRAEEIKEKYEDAKQTERNTAAADKAAVSEETH